MYILYILRCCDDSLYTGITNDLKNRLETHRSGNGSKYVRSRLPVEVVYEEECLNKSEALQREAEIKSWSKEEKIKLLDK